jgi:hypothetical protein
LRIAAGRPSKPAVLAVRPAQAAELDAEQEALPVPVRDGACDEHLVVAGSVEVSGVEQGDARIERGVNGCGALGVVGGAVSP